MTYFLTSMPCVMPGSPDLNPANGFVDELRQALSGPCRALFIASDPDDPERTERFAGVIRTGFELAGFRFDRYRVLDSRNAGQCAALVADADLLILSGGHVPTQNRFFHSIGLREKLRDWDGVLIGVSAGSMNAAELVYAPPEEEGEAIDPNYRRFYPGLGLTRTMVFPHFQKTRYEVVDGLPTLESSLLPDSMGRRIYAIVDGSYILGKDGREELRGEAYLIENGAMEQLTDDAPGGARNWKLDL